MTYARRVLAVGPGVVPEVEDALAASTVDVHRAADPGEALYELAANPIDCVVADRAIVTGESRFAEAIEDRSDLPVVVATPRDGRDDRSGGAEAWEAGAGSTLGAAIERPDDAPSTHSDAASGGATDLATAVREAVGASAVGVATGGGETGDERVDAGPAPVGPLTLVVADGTIVEANDQPVQQLAWEPGELVGTDLAEYVHPEDRPGLASLLDPEADEEATVLRLQHGDGDYREVWLERHAYGPDRVRIEVFLRECGELPEWFPQGEAAEELLAVIFAHVPIHLFVKDEDARHVWVSRYHTGDTSAAIGSRDLDFGWGAFGRQTHADDRQVIESGEPLLNREEYVPMQDDWNLTSKIPWIDDDGEVRGLVGVTWRITRRKQYEQRLERENERLERFANIVGHDLRNPINVARGRLELAVETGDWEHLDAVEDAIERMAHITEDLLTMAREGEWVSETQSVSLEALARCAWDMVDTAAATLEVDGDLTFEGDPDRLHHLFENCIRNAVEHGGDGVTVRVGPLPDGGFYVADDGVGIPDEERDRVFDAGRSSDGGSGLGLEIVRQVAEAHGWEVAATESDAGGACLEVTGVTTLE